MTITRSLNIVKIFKVLLLRLRVDWLIHRRRGEQHHNSGHLRHTDTHTHTHVPWLHILDSLCSAVCHRRRPHENHTQRGRNTHPHTHTLTHTVCVCVCWCARNASSSSLDLPPGPPPNDRPTAGHHGLTRIFWKGRSSATSSARHASGMRLACRAYANWIIVAHGLARIKKVPESAQCIIYARCAVVCMQLCIRLWRQLPNLIELAQLPDQLVWLLCLFPDFSKINQPTSLQSSLYSKWHLCAIHITI